MKRKHTVVQKLNTCTNASYTIKEAKLTGNSCIRNSSKGSAKTQVFLIFDKKI